MRAPWGFCFTGEQHAEIRPGEEYEVEYHSSADDLDLVDGPIGKAADALAEAELIEENEG